MSIFHRFHRGASGLDQGLVLALAALVLGCGTGRSPGGDRLVRPGPAEPARRLLFLSRTAAMDSTNVEELAAAGIAVATYRDGAQVDDAMEAYAWEVASGSSPIPVAVHEVTSPEQVAVAARTGFQQILPSDSVPHAADYFRCALAHFFDCRPRYFVSEGSVIDRLAMRNKDEGSPAEERHRWRLAVGARSTVPVEGVTLYQDGRPCRRWRPGAEPR